MGQFLKLRNAALLISLLIVNVYGEPFLPLPAIFGGDAGIEAGGDADASLHAGLGTHGFDVGGSKHLNLGANKHAGIIVPIVEGPGVPVIPAPPPHPHIAVQQVPEQILHENPTYPHARRIVRSAKNNEEVDKNNAKTIKQENVPNEVKSENLASINKNNVAVEGSIGQKVDSHQQEGSSGQKINAHQPEGSTSQKVKRALPATQAQTNKHRKPNQNPNQNQKASRPAPQQAKKPQTGPPKGKVPPKIVQRTADEVEHINENTVIKNETVSRRFAL